ncbi:MAG: hypothetical protein J6A78_04895 [Clostridia bacterium]|nr:hypothetical protein [Clostridia bacterium]
MPKNATSKYKAVSDGGGYRFIFYCDVSDAHVCTTKEIYKGNEEEALLVAWQTEGCGHFNLCHRCGKWVIDAVYNVEVLECVECAPYESEPKFCKNCGQKIKEPVKNCPVCGKKLIYEGCDDR